MTDYILNGWGNKDFWTLYNATWEEPGDYLECDLLGYGERELIGIYNKNWELYIYNCIRPTGGVLSGLEIQIFLEGDANPIIFRRQIDSLAGKRWMYFEYDGTVYGSTEDDNWETCALGYHNTRIWRDGTSYYCDDVLIANFDYGSLVKPSKLKVRHINGGAGARFRYPNWYYTEPIPLDQDYCFVA